MIDLLKKYRFNIIILLVLTGLLFFFIPNQESRYLRPDIEEIKHKSHIVLLWAEVIFLVILLLFELRQLKKITDIFYLFVGLGLMGLTLFFLFDSIFLSTTLFLNKLSKKETVDKSYKVVYVDDNKNLLLWDNDIKSSIQANQLIKATENINIKASDTLVVSFKKGLLGFNFDPTIK
ncbi:MAG: hypothetical protein ABIN67_21435 [Ferruginibacter sp.]